MTEQPMPGIKTINGHTYIKVQDLADAWHTSTSHILRTGKPNQVPEKYRRTIDGHTWCDVEGLRYRLSTMKRGGRIPSQLRQLLDRLPVLDFEKTGPLMETVYEKNKPVTIYRSTFQDIDDPSSEELQAALENRQVIYRYKNDCVQVLAQTLSNHLDTRTSSLLAVNKKQGVPRKFIHREWKRTWVDLEGLKQRVQNTEHGSALLKGLNWVVEYLDGEGKPFDELVKTMKQWKSASASAASERKRNASSTPKPEQKPSAPLGSKRNPIDPCDVAVKAHERSLHNTEWLNSLTTEVRNLETEAKRHVAYVPEDIQNVIEHVRVRLARVEGIMYDGIGPEGIDPDFLMKNQLDDIRNSIKKQATQADVNQTLLGELNTRLGRLATQADRLDGKTDGLESRVTVLEDTSKWLSWTLAGVIGIRFLGLMLRMLKRK